MTDAAIKNITDTIEKVVAESWKDEEKPLMLSNLPPFLKEADATYKDILGKQSLKEFIENSSISDAVKVVRHPKQKARIGLIPSTESFTYPEIEIETDKTAKSKSKKSENTAVTLLEILSSLTEEELKKRKHSYLYTRKAIQVKRMKLLVGLVSSNKWLCDKFNKEQGSLIPNSKKFEFIDFSLKVFDPTKIEEGIQERLRKNINKFDAIILLTETSHEKDVFSVKNSFLVNTFRYSKDEDNHKNYFQHRLGKLIKNLVEFNEIVKKADMEKLSILPIRNFQSDDLVSLTKTFQENMLADDFLDQILPFFKKIKQKKQPRRDSKNKKQYIVDDGKRYFEFGKDKEHGNFATGGSHLPSCEISGIFRFGRKVLQDGHFNVCLDKNKVIWGDFQNCHDMTVSIRKGDNNDHLNMFINDHIRGEENVT